MKSLNPRVVCPYCGELARLVRGEDLYKKRADLKLKLFWLCKPCDAWVGCHGHSYFPFGTLANKPLRELRYRTHAHFDQIWQAGIMSRKDAYAWLAAELGLKVRDTHIGMFDVAMCQKVIDAIKCARNRANKGVQG